MLDVQQQSDSASCQAVHSRSKNKTRGSTLTGKKRDAEKNADSCLQWNNLCSSASSINPDTNQNEALSFSCMQGLRSHLSSIEHIQYLNATQSRTICSDKDVTCAHSTLQQCPSSSERNAGRFVEVQADHHYSDSQPFFHSVTNQHLFMCWIFSSSLILHPVWQCTSGQRIGPEAAPFLKEKVQRETQILV